MGDLANNVRRMVEMLQAENVALREAVVKLRKCVDWFSRESVKYGHNRLYPVIMAMAKDCLADTAKLVKEEE